MRLMQDHSPGAYAVSVTCLHCGRMVPLADCTIDRDGEAFRAYFCPRCTPQGMPVAPCTLPTCARCHATS